MPAYWNTALRCAKILYRVKPVATFASKFTSNGNFPSACFGKIFSVVLESGFNGILFYDSHDSQRMLLQGYNLYQAPPVERFFVRIKSVCLYNHNTMRSCIFLVRMTFGACAGLFWWFEVNIGSLIHEFMDPMASVQVAASGGLLDRIPVDTVL